MMEITQPKQKHLHPNLPVPEQVPFQFHQALHSVL